jgi:hypothetical protein
MKQEEDADHLELKYTMMLIQKAGIEMCGSSSNESSYNSSSSFLQTSKKCTSSDLYSSSGNDLLFLSTNDNKMSILCTPNHASQSKSHELKKTKLVNVSHY